MRDALGRCILMVPGDDTMTRLSITVDDELVEEAKRLTNSRTKRATIERALTELIQRQRIAKLIALIDSDAVDMTPEELRQWRDSSIPEDW